MPNSYGACQFTIPILHVRITGEDSWAVYRRSRSTTSSIPGLWVDAGDIPSSSCRARILGTLGKLALDLVLLSTAEPFVVRYAILVYTKYLVPIIFVAPSTSERRV
jgi:hypothetical protein